METQTLLLLGGIALGLIGGFLDRLAEEADSTTPIIGKYRGLIRAVGRALTPRNRRRPDPSPKQPK